MTRWLEAGALQHAIGRVLPLPDVVSAHELVERGDVMGNVVLTMRAA
jgi:NADPH2:quinone reductase